MRNGLFYYPKNIVDKSFKTMRTRVDRFPGTKNQTHFQEKPNSKIEAGARR